LYVFENVINAFQVLKLHYCCGHFAST